MWVYTISEEVIIILKYFYIIIYLTLATLGSINLSQDVTLTVISGLNGASPQFTLTCISTGGPATTVTWTRDSVNVTEGTETVLDDPVTAQYIHTLTVTGRLNENYTCNVSNSRPSSAIGQYYVWGM